jgi:hypothetical protein
MTEAEQQARGRGRGGRGGFGGGRGGAPSASPQFPSPSATTVLTTVSPGEYRVVLNSGGREYTQRALVLAER